MLSCGDPVLRTPPFGLLSENASAAIVPGNTAHMTDIDKLAPSRAKM